ncbi:MAG: DUF2341 domain-containing protein [Chthoniobacterales bacterium]
MSLVTKRASLPWRRGLLLGVTLLFLCSNSAFAWWNKSWTIRKKITVDTSAKGAAITDPIGGTVVLVRLPEGAFQFAVAKEDGSDLRFVAEDDKTPLTFHLEKFDSLMGEAFAWVKVPEVKANGQTSFWMYYGDQGTTESVNDPKGTYDADTMLVYHFAERAAPPADATKNGNNASNAGAPVDGSMIGGGARFVGGTPITIPASPSLAWNDGGTATISAWIKPVTLSPGAVFLSRQEGANVFAMGIDNGVPFVQVNGQRTAAGAPMAVNSWHHFAMVAGSGKVTLYLDGEEYGTIAAPLPALNSPILLGGENETAFSGEMDELEISRVARSPGSMKFASYSQGGEKAGKLLSLGQDEQKHSWFNGGGTMAVLVGSLTVDGWIVIIVLLIMACGSWGVMVHKIRYLNAISKGNALFMKQWKHVAEDLTVLDDGDAESFRSMGGRVGAEGQRAMRNASVYRIYHLGVEEIRHRIEEDNAREGNRRGLAGRSIQAIRATLDGGLVRETQKINRLLVLLTICISGGPFLGLLGTVIGVMITFAAIAAAGDVNVNAIAPGIAAALLATVAGLAVAVPALFGYNYIISRVKDAKDDMHIFIDEFVTKMAEFYRENPEPYRRQPELFQETASR